MIGKLNEMLKRSGFPSIRSSSHSSFLRLIESLLGKIEEISFGVSFLTIEEVFKKLFNRIPDKNSKYDLAVVNLISVYEQQRRGYEKEMDFLNKSLQSNKKAMSQIEENMRKGYHKALNDMQSKLNMLESRCSDLKPETKPNFDENQEIIEEISMILSINHPSHIVPAVVKLEKVLRAVPQLEKFIKEVYQIVQSEDPSTKVSMEQVIPSLKNSLKQLKSLKSQKKNLEPTSFHQEVLEHFKHLFEIEKNEDIIETMDQVFLFVHELRSFLKSIRIALDLDEGVTVGGVLMRLKQMIESY